ncbi:MAG: hypothetical protein A2428_14480 [Bdellovibrionales bacterium RIFOXYC1_FULL_54_43]|nr:MAG: hypothetical protein A2428_14480 [Bdellovibrionales bacterium RIFOXYC1_FULL_54_43]OFZ78340.1 MAG: hypothetical protein A2603_12440 [Bdellovibrionales bacterium RIFOXYD1_FULL_55_31]
MALTYSEKGSLGEVAPDFELPGVDGKTYRARDFLDAKAWVVVFMCNHCPYVKAVQDRINSLAKQYAPRGVKVVGINSNDSTKYPEDDFDAMKACAKEQGYVFPYLWDTDQSVAREYGAVCTPDFYLYAPGSKGRDSNVMVLKYRGRLDDCWSDEAKVTKRDLAHAIDRVLEGRDPDSVQPPSMGCSIKWK